MDKDGRPRARAGGGSMLVPSGEDANPLNRRLPAEVVTRRRPNARAPRVEERVQEEVDLDLKAVLVLKPEARPKWLAKACKAADEGRASAPELYNIVSSRKFVAGLPTRISKKLATLVREHLELFSDKQQRYLDSMYSPLAASRPAETGARDGHSEEEVDDAAARMEEMMARCRAFVREKANTFEDRAAEVAETERKAHEQALRDFEHGRLLAEDARLHQRAREEQERALREAQEAEERARREAHERVERERRAAWEAEMARRRAEEAEAARKRMQELEVDSSMLMVLERKSVAAAAPEAAREKAAAEAIAKRKQGGLSRSRSVSGGSRSSSGSLQKKRSRKRSRSAERRRRKRSSSSSSSGRRRRRKREARDEGGRRPRRRRSSSRSSSRKSS
mmetsp:Transcript_114720/g.335450  ORF Transcript_114720/g.335450 Transcript_114720/m.335450 type:complete len:394 (+) Transcript_114720:59-1240(+)